MRVHTVLITALVAALVAGCSSSGPTGQATTAPPAPSPSVIGSVSPSRSGGPPKMPTNYTAASAIGHAIFITPKGLVPRELIAGINKSVVFWNETSQPLAVTFLNYGDAVTSGSIPPNGSWTFHSRYDISIIYATGPRPAFRGNLQYQPV